ncbi:MAG: type VI secretion system tip protein TssI/VgrG [Pseudomonadota bacterium]
MSKDLDFENRMLRMEGDYSCSPTNLKNARVIEQLSTLTETTIEFLSSNHALDLQDMLGKSVTLIQEDEDKSERYFTGTCISVEYVGLYQGMSHFVAELRPWLWFLTRTRENRIFQEKSVLDILKDVLGKYGFWADVKNSCSASYKPRTYCVQYAETDFDFICRLMEEEGIYYFFIQDGKRLKMVLADSISAHKPVPGKAEIQFHFKESEYRRDDDHIFDWAEATGATTGKVTLEDYDFEAPKKDLKVVKAMPKGKHNLKNFEDYHYPGRVREGTGDTFARVRMEAEAVRHKLSRGAGNVRTMSVGQTFKLKEHPRKVNNIEYLIVRAVHSLQIETDYEDNETKKPLFDTKLEVDEDNKDTYRTVFDVIPKTEPFRAPQNTPWPRNMGMQTAVVTGPSGDEIYTDKFGRIKVQFHWDRDGKKDEKTTCWVRCVMPWTGVDWGMISIPRIGQEVVIQFEEGDPDRPICTGMLYNTDTMPPYGLPANMTQTGIKTRSTKGAGSDNYHELVFEDKKGEEFIRFHSEKDYFQTVENNAEIKIGLDKKDKGDLTQTIHRHKTETLNTGDHTFTVKSGNQKIYVAVDHDETIDGKADQTIKKDSTVTVTDGNYTQTVKMGDVTREVSMGKESHTLKMGNYSLKTSLGAISMEAMTKIELKVGGNSIKIDQSGITLDGIMIKIKGKAMANVEAPMTNVKGQAMLILNGGVTMIN